MKIVYRAIDVLRELGIDEDMSYKGIEYQRLLDAVILLLHTPKSLVRNKITLQLIVDVVHIRD